MSKSLKTFIEENRIRADVVMSGEPNPDWDQPHNAWRVTLKLGRKRLTTPFYTGMGITREPSAEDVLDSMASDSASYENAQGFEDWCSEYGYDTDSRKAERLYRQIARQTDKLRRFLGAEAFEELLWEVERQ